MDSKAIRTAGPQGQQGHRDSRTTSYSLQSNKHQEYTHTILCLTGDCHQLFSTSQQTSRIHSHHPVPYGWLSSAILYKPTNIISTFTPLCACDCHKLCCTSQQTSSTTHSHHPVSWGWLSPAILYKPTNIINNTFTPSCILGVTVTSYSVQANKHPQEHAHTILCLGLTCHQPLSTTTSQQTSSAQSHRPVPVTVTNHSLPATRCHKHSHLPVSSGPLEWWSCHVLWHLTAHWKETWTMEGHSGKERTLTINADYSLTAFFFFLFF